MNKTDKSTGPLVAAGILVVLALGLTGCGSDRSQPAGLPSDITPTASLTPTPLAADSIALVDDLNPKPQPTRRATPIASPQPFASPTPEPTASPVTPEGSEPTPTPTSRLTQESIPLPDPSPTAVLDESPEQLENSNYGEVAEAGRIFNGSLDLPWGAEEHLMGDGVLTRAAWLLSWRDGFLHIGHGITGGYDNNVVTAIDRSSLLYRTSSDGLHWTEPSQLSLPNVHFPTSELEDWASKWSSRWSPCVQGYCTVLITEPSDCTELYSSRLECRITDTPVSTIFDIVSTGNRIIVGSQWNDKVYVSVTSDLVAWDTLEFTLDGPAGLHESLSTLSIAKGFAIGPSGWLLEVEAVTYFDLISIIPFEIADSALVVHIPQWHYCNEGDESMGQLIRFSTDSRSNTDEEGCILWTDSTIPWAQYREYGTHGSKGFQPRQPDRNSGSVWTADWGQSPVRSNLPRPAEGTYMGTCCMVIGTSEGYLAIEDTIGPGYGAAWGLPTELFYSADGIEWSTIQHTVSDAAWINSFFVLQNGIIFSSCEIHSFWHPDNNTVADTWIADSDGGNWRRSESSEFAGSVPGCPSYPSNLFHLEFNQELMSRVDLSRSGDGAMAKNNDIVIWFGSGRKIERRVLEE